MISRFWSRREPLRLGIVGCGDIASYTALVSRLVPCVRLAACCDRNAERAQSFARRHRIPQVFTEYEALLESAELDAVYLALPHDLHLDFTCRAMEAGKPVFLEKPLARTWEEGKRLVEAVEKLGVKVGVNYQYRYDRGCYALARAVQSGALGKVISVRINVPWRRERSYFDGAGWHTSVARSGGGTLLTQGSHFLDIALWALGERAVSAVAYTSRMKFPEVEVEDTAHGIFEMESGALVQIASTMAASSEQAASIEVYGERGTAIYRDRPLPHVRFASVQVRPERPPEWGIHALQRSLSAFCRWVQDGMPYLTAAVEALPVLSVIDAMYHSAKSGKKETCEHEP